MTSPASLTLDKLDADVLETVLLALNDESRQSLLSLTTVSRTLHDATIPILYRHCSFDFSENRLAGTTRRIESLLDDSTGAITFIRFITVKGTASYSLLPGEESKAPDLAPIAQLLTRITNLIAFTFNVEEQIPITLLDVLHTHHPSAHLHVRNWTRASPSTPCGDPAEEALAVSPGLRSFHAHFITGGPDRDHRLVAFHRVVALAPNLESISLTSRSAGGCVVYGFSLEELDAVEREAKKFSVPKPVRKVIKSVTMDSMDAHNLRELSKITDLSKLTSLQCTPSTEFLSLASGDDIVFRLSSLRTLSVKLKGRYWADDAEAALGELYASFTTFLASCGELESLSIASIIINRPWPPLLPTILLYHGSSLRSLSLHHVESPNVERACLSSGDLSSICNAFPNLRGLAFDINRTIDGGSEGEYYTALRTLTQLRELKIHMDLGLPILQHDQLMLKKSFMAELTSEEEAMIARMEAYPIVGEDFARDVWTAITRKDEKDQGRIVEGPRLDELVLYIGEQDREIGRGYPAGWVLSERSNRQCLTVRRSYHCSEDVVVTIKGAQPPRNDNDNGGEAEEEEEEDAGAVNSWYSTYKRRE